jgi:hypothetical protein
MTVGTFNTCNSNHKIAKTWRLWRSVTPATPVEFSKSLLEASEYIVQTDYLHGYWVLPEQLTTIQLLKI